MEEKESKGVSVIVLLGSVAGSVVAILGLLWLIGESFLEDYVEGHIKAYEEKKIEEDSKKIPFRIITGEKMGVPPDEVHIKIGEWYKEEKERDKDFKEVKILVHAIKKEFDFYHPGNMIDDYAEDIN